MNKVLLCLALIFAPCQLLAQDVVGEADALPTLAVEDVPDDVAIATRLRAILGALEFDGITVSVDAGVVSLAGDVAEPSISEKAESIAERLEGVVAVKNTLSASDDLANQINPAVDRFRARVERLVSRLPLLLLALAAFLVIVAAGFLVARMRFWDRISPNAFIAELYRQAFRVASGIVGIVVALDVLGAAALLGTILGAAGIIGLAIGFAVRDTVENFVASVMLSLRQPFRPNDLVEIEGDIGRVIRLTSRATILLSLDGNHIRIPNATVFKGKIVNYTQYPARRFLFDIGIDPDADLEATRSLAQATLKALPFVLDDPEELVWIENITESGAILRVTGWVDQTATGFAAARGDAIRLVKTAIEEAGVAIPDTTYRIRLEGAGMPAASSGPPSRKAPEPQAPAASPEPSAHKSEEAALIPLVDAERRDCDDLLARGAPRE
ncbi:mechanosensitive ion channel [Salipiger thiooxidans]|uniref:mechanosensitive ion channel family protein n=1 Tax=Salipiger thiooxidans TaxID=282683 RepID=UPI001A8E8A5D|nr:mechanosensitive ion channel family protein [Salipiger thiooxidans]MBN8190087.1 mechanosensitive ion channel [Salipiger thiooxidans]